MPFNMSTLSFCIAAILLFSKIDCKISVILPCLQISCQLILGLRLLIHMVYKKVHATFSQAKVQPLTAANLRSGGNYYQSLPIWFRRMRPLGGEAVALFGVARLVGECSQDIALSDGRS